MDCYDNNLLMYRVFNETEYEKENNINHTATYEEIYESWYDKFDIQILITTIPTTYLIDIFKYIKKVLNITLTKNNIIKINNINSMYLLLKLPAIKKVLAERNIDIYTLIKEK